MSTSSNSNDEEYDKLRQTIYEYYEEERPKWKQIARKYGVTAGKLKGCYNAWIPSSAQPQSWHDFHFEVPSAGRPCKLGDEHESVIAEAAKYYADNQTPLSKSCLKILVQSYVSLLPQDEQKKIGFKDGITSVRWVKSFSERNNLS